jgi:hypothetical protein
MYFLTFRGRSRQKAAWREFCRIIRHLGSGMIRPFAQNIWDLRPPVSVEFSRGQRPDSASECRDGDRPYGGEWRVLL